MTSCHLTSYLIRSDSIFPDEPRGAAANDIIIDWESRFARVTPLAGLKVFQHGVLEGHFTGGEVRCMIPIIPFTFVGLLPDRFREQERLLIECFQCHAEWYLCFKQNAHTQQSLEFLDELNVAFKALFVRAFEEVVKHGHQGNAAMASEAASLQSLDFLKNHGSDHYSDQLKAIGGHVSTESGTVV